MKRFKVLILGMFLLAIMTGTTWADKYSVSLGAVSVPDYEGSDDYTVIPALSLRGQYENGIYFSLDNKFKLNLIPSRVFNFGPILNYRQARDNVHSDQVSALDEVGAAFEAGVFGQVNFNQFTLGLEVLTDISNEHDGTLVKATAGYHWRVMDELMLSPTVHITYADSEYMDTYFSITSANRGHSTLPGFKADGGIKDVGLTILSFYRTPWPQWGVMGILGYRELLNDAKDSPIVKDEGDNKQALLGLMVSYHW